MTTKGKRFHFEGNDNDGAAFFTECNNAKSEEELTVIRAERPESGKPLKLGQRLGTFRKGHDGHFRVTEISSGPPQVATESYREGWDRVFGSNGVN